MRKMLLLFVYLMCVLATNAQISSLNENFDAACVLSNDFPSGWSSYNTIPETVSFGSWSCTPTNGENGTPGMQCSGDSSGTDHIDTSLLITPNFEISRVTGHLYLQFDTKITYLGTGTMSALEASDTSTSALDTPAGLHPLGILPVFDSTQNNQWVTHQIEITDYTGSPFYIAFMYTSPDNYGTVWYIDNVFTTPFALSVSSADKEQLPLMVVGNPTTSAIKVSFSTEGGDYNLLVYDMLGQQVHKEVVNTKAGPSVYTINDLNLPPGMYVVKMSNGLNYGYAKAVVE